MVPGRGSDLRGGGADLSQSRRVLVIFNPAADGGRGIKRIPRYLELLRELLPEHEHVVTSRSGEEATVVDRALHDGYGTIVAVGGDGTWSAVADRILQAGLPEVVFGILPAGTGNDFGRNLGIRGDDLEAAVRTVAAGRTHRVDVGRIRGLSRHEERERAPVEGRYFLNVVGFGFDVAVVDGSRSARFLRGELLYRTTALRQLFRYPGFSVTLEDGEGFQVSGPTLMLTVTNGKYFGGGFPIAPRARLQDGYLHACHIGNAGALRRMALFDRAGKGLHEAAPEIRTHRAPAFRLTFPDAVRFEIDGDIYVAPGGAVEIEVQKAALPVLAPQV